MYLRKNKWVVSYPLKGGELWMDSSNFCLVVDSEWQPFGFMPRRSTDADGSYDKK